MTSTHAVGIDLGTTYSCIAYLNEHGEPVSIPNQEGEISTPSVVLYENGEEIVGTEALRNAIMNPAHVVQNAKRWMGDNKKQWTIDGKTYTPVDIATAVLKKLLAEAQRKIGPIERAVITVPAQFSEAQRLATVEAGERAGLKEVEMINEPVAAALCYVLGTEGSWFSELTSEQRILVYDLGGGTFDLSLVTYRKDQVRVIASTGDLHLGGIDWNQCLLNAVAEQFTREFHDDPRRDPESLQHLAWEIEQCKRSLTVRPKAALIVQHAGKRKTYQIERDQFNQLTQHLVRRTREITQKLVDTHKAGASHLDLTVLSCGGSSRMPMIEGMLQELKGTTLSKALSPDQSIAQGAAYYAGMLLTNREFSHSIIDPDAVARLSKMRQQSVNARDLGILIRDMKTDKRVPYYLVPANTPLPASATKAFGTVIPNQKRVNLFIVESGAGTDKPYAELGNCTINELPPNLPAESRIAVTISYDESARVQVSARDVTSGQEARTEIQRGENLLVRDVREEEAVSVKVLDEPAGGTRSKSPGPAPARSPVAAKPQASRAPAEPAKPARSTPGSAKAPLSAGASSAAVPILLCEKCGGALNVHGECLACKSRGAPRPVGAQPAAGKSPAPVRTQPAKPPVRPISAGAAPIAPPRKPDSSEIMELPRKNPAAAPKKVPPRPSGPQSLDPGEEEFWKLAGQ
jgi:molecular chaperone DnaK